MILNSGEKLAGTLVNDLYTYYILYLGRKYWSCNFPNLEKFVEIVRLGKQLQYTRCASAGFSGNRIATYIHVEREAGATFQIAGALLYFATL